MRKRGLTAKLALAVLGIAVASLAAYMFKVGLDRADKLAGIASFFVGTAGLVLAAYGLVGNHKIWRTHGQSVTSSHVGGNASQILGVGGSVSIGATQGIVGAGTEVPVEATGQISKEANQGIADADVAGDVYQVGDVAGNVDIEKY